jgi:predicted HTH transcriptional regulator
MTFPFTHDPPPIGERESATLEFKVECSKIDGLDKVDYFQLAKDVAGFANTSGGTIFIGAVAKSDVLVRYKPMSEVEARASARHVEEAVRDRCRPQPPPSRRD